MTLLMTILFLACEKEEKTTVWVYHPRKVGSGEFIDKASDLKYFRNESTCEEYARELGMKAYETGNFSLSTCLEIPYEIYYKNLK